MSGKPPFFKWTKLATNRGWQRIAPGTVGRLARSGETPDHAGEMGLGWVYEQTWYAACVRDGLVDPPKPKPDGWWRPKSSMLATPPGKKPRETD